MPSSSTHCRSPSIIITEEDEDLDNGIGMEDFGSKDVVLRHHVKVARDERQLLTRDDQQTDRVRLYIPYPFCYANQERLRIIKVHSSPPRYGGITTHLSLTSQSLFIQHLSPVAPSPVPSSNL